MSVFANLGSFDAPYSQDQSDYSNFDEEFQDNNDWGDEGGFYEQGGGGEDEWGAPPPPRAAVAKKAAAAGPTLRVNKAAANRLIRHAINKAFSMNMQVETDDYREQPVDDDATDPREEEESPPSPTTHNALAPPPKRNPLAQSIDTIEKPQKVAAVVKTRTVKKSATKAKTKKAVVAPEPEQQQQQQQQPQRLVRRSLRLLVKDRAIVVSDIRHSTFSNIATGGPIWFDGLHKRMDRAAAESKTKKYAELTKRRAAKKVPTAQPLPSTLSPASPVTPPRGSAYVLEQSSPYKTLQIPMSPKPATAPRPSRVPPITFIVGVPFVSSLPTPK